MFHVWKFRIKLLKILQWEFMGVYDFFPLLEIGFFGINTDLRIYPNWIPYTGTTDFGHGQNHSTIWCITEWRKNRKYIIEMGTFEWCNICLHFRNWLMASKMLQISIVKSLGMWQYLQTCNYIQLHAVTFMPDFCNYEWICPNI